MINYIEVDALGQIKNSGVAAVSDLDVLRKCMPQSILIEVTEPTDPDKFFWSGEAVLAFPDAPDPLYQWDWKQKRWVDLLPSIRKEKETDLVLKIRQKAYPPIGDQLDALWKELGAGAKTPEAKAIATSIAFVKLNNPKPN